MIAIDTNLMVYAHQQEAPFHDAAKKVLAEVLGHEAVGIAWPCCHEFFSVMTHPKVWKQPFTSDEALACIEHLHRVPRVQVLSEGADHLSRLQALCAKSQLHGGQIHDARIAAICLSHGVKELWSCDRDFSRFPALRVRNPLIR